GDGGDELFAGYHRYGWGERVWGNVGPIPAPLRSLGAGAARLAGAALPAASPAARRLGQASRLLDCADVADLYGWPTRTWPDSRRLMRDPPRDHVAIDRAVINGTPLDTVSGLQLLDMAQYLPEDILTKLDRATMAVSLEGRVPLLDHRVVEHAWTLPT